MGLKALAVVVPLALLAGCGSPRERDCRMILPRLEEAETSTSVTGNMKAGPARVFATQAARSAAAARWLTSASLATEEMKRDLPPLVAALEQASASARRADDALRALGIHAPADARAHEARPMLAKLYAPESREKTPFVDEALVLNERCGIFLARAAADHAECGALSTVFERFVAPAEGISTADHVATTVAALGGIHSPDARVEGALRMLESLVREVSAVALAAIADGPAVAMVAQLRILLTAVPEQQRAHRAVAERAATIRATCNPSGAPAPPVP